MFGLLCGSRRCLSAYAKFVLIIVLLFCNSAFASVQSDLSTMMSELQFAPATSDKLFCHVPDTLVGFDKDYPHAQYMLDIASAKNTVVFVHGFIPTKPGGEHNIDGMVGVWQQHIEIIEDSTDTAFCVVTWDTEYGHDDPAQTLSKFLTAYYMAAQDNRRATRPTPNLVLVGHSAGGNYIKYNYVKTFPLMAQIQQSMKVYTHKVNTQILTLGTPHLGTPMAQDVAMYTFFGGLIAKILNWKEGQNVASAVASKAFSRGAELLLPEVSNPSLQWVNREFVKYFSRTNVFAIGGINDEYVPLISAAPSFTTQFSMSATHDDFLEPIRNPGFYQFLTAFYAGRKIQ